MTQLIDMSLHFYICMHLSLVIGNNLDNFIHLG